MSLTIRMDPIEELPIPPRGGKAARIAHEIWGSAAARHGAFLAAEDDKRGLLEAVNRHLRSMGNVRTIVRYTHKDANGTPDKFALFVEWDEEAEPQEPRRRKRADAIVDH